MSASVRSKSVPAPAYGQSPPQRRRPRFISALALPRQPFLYLVAALTAGILADLRLESPFSFPAGLAAVALVWLMWSAMAKRTRQAAAAMLVIVAAAGAALSLAERAGVRPSRLK